MVELQHIMPDEIEETWPQVEPYIASALDFEPQMQSANDLKKQCLIDSCSLLIVKINGTIVGAATLSLEDTPQSKLCVIITIGGDRFSEWKKAVFSQIEQFAAETGCRYVMAMGRQGWQRTMPDYKHARTLYCKEVYK